MKLWSRRKYITARAIILEDRKLLTFHRKRLDKSGKWIEYYSLPGGQIDAGETPESAVIRELHEEMGVKIKPLKLVAHSKEKIFEHYIFAAEIISGKPALMADSEEMTTYANEMNQYRIAWVDVDKLTENNLKFYSIFYRHIMAMAEGLSLDEISGYDVPKRVY